MNDLISVKLKEIVRLQDIIKQDDLSVEKLIILVNFDYLLFFLRDIHNVYLSLEKAGNKQSNFANELKNFEKFTKIVEKKSFLKIIDNFKSRWFPIKKE